MSNQHPLTPKRGPATRTKILATARRQAAAANRAAQADPDNHELRTKAFALAATVKTIEGLVEQRQG
jgi:hypothetical protein